MASHLLDDYLALQGDTETPPRFHHWAFWAGLSATVADRVSLQKIPGENLCPNLYVILIGASAAGKGLAIHQILPLVRATKRVQLYEGEITASAFVKQMHKQKDKLDPIDPAVKLGSRCFLVQEELAHDVGVGNMAFDFVRMMTGLYKYNPGDWNKETIHGKRYSLRRILFTWIAGSTWEWFQKTVPVDDLRAGFGRRIIPIAGERNPDKRVALPQQIEHHDEKLRQIWERWQMLVRLEGEFHFSDLGRQTFTNWYEQRPNPPPEMEPWFYAIDDLVLKMAVLHHCCLLGLGDECTWLLTASDVRAGIRWAADGYRDVSAMLERCAFSVELQSALRVYRVVQRYGHVEKSIAMNESHSSAGDFQKSVNTLVGRRWIEAVKVNGEPGYVDRGTPPGWDSWVRRNGTSDRPVGVEVTADGLESTRRAIHRPARRAALWKEDWPEDD